MRHGLAALGLALALAACIRAEDAPPAGGAAPQGATGQGASGHGALPAGEALPPPGMPADTAGLVQPLETWRGSQGGVDVQSTMRAATAEEWQTLWSLAGAAPPRPLAVGREVATGVFLGQRPTGGYGVEILGLRARTGGPGSDLVWRETEPPRDALLSQALTTPWQIAVFPAEAIPTGFGGFR
jgi:hypothetical protein